MHIQKAIRKYSVILAYVRSLTMRSKICSLETFRLSFQKCCVLAASIHLPQMKEVCIHSIFTKCFECCIWMSSMASVRNLTSAGLEGWLVCVSGRYCVGRLSSDTPGHLISTWLLSFSFHLSCESTLMLLWRHNHRQLQAYISV